MQQGFDEYLKCGLLGMVFYYLMRELLKLVVRSVKNTRNNLYTIFWYQVCLISENSDRRMNIKAIIWRYAYAQNRQQRLETLYETARILDVNPKDLLKEGLND